MHLVHLEVPNAFPNAPKTYGQTGTILQGLVFK